MPHLSRKFQLCSDYLERHAAEKYCGEEMKFERSAKEPCAFYNKTTEVEMGQHGDDTIIIGYRAEVLETTANILKLMDAKMGPVIGLGPGDAREGAGPVAGEAAKERAAAKDAHTLA